MKSGASRHEEVLQPVSGRALPVYRGEVLRITQLMGGQCVDYNAFNIHDYKERMSIGHSRRQGFHLVEGNVLVSNPPRYRPMFLISHMPKTCVADTLSARCHAVLFERSMGFDFHTNCQDTLAEAIREYDLTPDDVHDSFNMFMNTNWDANGRRGIEQNTGRPGDYVDLLACMDTLSVPIICGSGDVQLTSNFFLKPVKIEIFESTPSALEAVDEVEERYAAPKSRRSLEDYKVSAIRTDRRLRPNPGYRSQYARYPLRVETLKIPLGKDARRSLDELIVDGFADDMGDAIRRAFMEWYLDQRVRRVQELDRSSLFQAGRGH